MNVSEYKAFFFLTKPSRSILLIALLATVTISCDPDLSPPETIIDDRVEQMHGVPIPDPYHWLEDRTSTETQDWINQQNEYAEQVVGNSPVRTQIEERLKELNDIAISPSPREAGDYHYFSLRLPGKDLPVIYRTKLQENEKADSSPIDPFGKFETVLDPHGLSPENTTRFSIIDFNKEGNLMLYSVRDGGEDEIRIRTRNVLTSTDLPDSMPRSLYGTVFFSHDQKGIYYVKRSRTIGPRVMYHALGTEISEDQLIFGQDCVAEQFINVKEVNDGRHLLFTVQHGWAKSEVHFMHMAKDKAVSAIVDDIDARFYTSFIDGELFMRTDYGADNNRLLAVDLENPGRSNWREVIPEKKHVMESFVKIEDKFYVTYLNNGSNEIKVFDEQGDSVGEISVPSFHRASIKAKGEKKAQLTVESFLTPSTIYSIDLASGERSLWSRREVNWSPDNYVVEQVWRKSKDGTSLPMWIVRHKDHKLNGKNPTWLSGYGGFYVARKPGFSATVALWLELGGVYAVATLRGGNEYGESWHKAGMLLNKQNVFDDFISAAELLIDQGYTNSDRLLIQGGSNGGLLVGAALTQRPELFRAVLCGFPDVDILRFPWYMKSNNAPALLEYGDSRIPEHFQAIREYSPYQNVVSDTDYPAVMLTTGNLDTRVPPSAALKMTARLQASTTSGYPIILRYHEKAGHAAGRGLSFNRRIVDTAMELTFAVQELGVRINKDRTN